MQKGSAEIGMHKHAFSGHGGKSPKHKVNAARRANEEIQRGADLRNKRAKAYPQFGTPSDCFKSHKNI